MMKTWMTWETGDFESWLSLQDPKNPRRCGFLLADAHVTPLPPT